jgi:hypothetical protein
MDREEGEKGHKRRREVAEKRKMDGQRGKKRDGGMKKAIEKKGEGG